MIKLIIYFFSLFVFIGCSSDISLFEENMEKNEKILKNHNNKAIANIVSIVSTNKQTIRKSKQALNKDCKVIFGSCLRNITNIPSNTVVYSYDNSSRKFNRTRRSFSTNIRLISITNPNYVGLVKGRERFYIKKNAIINNRSSCMKIYKDSCN